MIFGTRIGLDSYIKQESVNWCDSMQFLLDGNIKCQRAWDAAYRPVQANDYPRKSYCRPIVLQQKI